MKIVLVLFFFAIAADAAYEGDYCEKDGVSGVCINLQKCPSAIEDLKHRRPPQNCGFGGSNPIVCCIASATTARPVLTTTKRTAAASTTEYVPPVYDYQDALGDKRGDGCEPIDPQLTSKKTGRKAWDKCLDYQNQLVFPCGRSNALAGGMSRVNRCHHNADELIIGGTAAVPNEFPHMALVGYGDDVSNIQWLCGGTLISEKFVLTAGHCIASRDFGPASYVLLGTLKKSDENGSKRFKVKRIIRHPEYNPPHKYHDIALLELEQSVPLTEYIVPACLHTGEPVDDSRASATGWGLTEYRGGTADVLQKVILTKFETPECAQKYKPNRLMLNGFDINTQTCYGDRNMSKDTCQGDSGGPLQVKSRSIVCMYTVVGVTSFGKACGFIGEPGIYTRVVHYLDWLENLVWP